MKRIGLLVILTFVGISTLVEGARDSEIRPPADRWENEGYWKDIRCGRVFICYDTGIDVYKATLEELGISDKRVLVVEKLNPKLNMMLVSVPGDVDDTKEFIRSIEKKPYVRWAEPDRWIRLFFTPNDTYWDIQYDKLQMNCEAAWDSGFGSMEISASVIDQGCQYSHEDLAARYVGYVGYDYLDNDDDPTVPHENQLHGTHCSGILAATINNDTGIAGVANVRLLSYRCGDGQTLDAAACVNSIEESADSGWNILSLSWGSTDYMANIATAVDYAWNAGCLIFAATGNAGMSSILYPARDSKVIAVGAINSSGTRPGFSNYGNEMELVAGGVAIVSTVPFDEYVCYDGTSMACPNAAGAGALVWSAKPSATSQEIRSVLCSTAVDLGPSGWDNKYGYGKPDCYAAIQALPPDTGTPIIWANDSLNFRFEQKSVSLPDTASISRCVGELKGMAARGIETYGGKYAGTGIVWVKNIGTGGARLEVTDVQVALGASWITSTAPTSFRVAKDCSVGIEVEVDTSGLQKETLYTDEIVITSNSQGKAETVVPVTLYIDESSVEENDLSLALQFKTSPNPFKERIAISYEITRRTHVKLVFSDIAGREMITLVDEFQNPGVKEASWRTANVPAGVYFCRFTTPDFDVTRKVLLVK